jgi:hypothetical protein
LPKPAQVLQAESESGKARRTAILKTVWPMSGWSQAANRRLCKLGFTLNFA